MRNIQMYLHNIFFTNIKMRTKNLANKTNKLSGKKSEAETA